MAMCVMAVFGASAMPVLLARWEPDHVAWPYLFDRAAPVLRVAAAGCHDQRLAQGVGMPRGPSTGLERDAGADRAGRTRCLEQRVNAYRASKVIGRPLAGRF